MTRRRTDEEIEAFGRWLAERLPDAGATGTSGPDQALLDRAWALARQTVAAREAASPTDTRSGSRADQAPAQRLYRETLLPMAASDGVLRDGPVRIDSLGGEWSLTREIVPDDRDWQILKFQCREELIPELQGRAVRVHIGERELALGEIDSGGVAEAWVPRDLDFRQAIEVLIAPSDSD